MKYKEPKYFECLQCPDCNMTEIMQMSVDGMPNHNSWQYLTDEEDGTEYIECACGCKFLEKYETIKRGTNEFIEGIYEIAFGDNAINREFSFEEVLNKIREYSDGAYKKEIE